MFGYKSTNQRLTEVTNQLNKKFIIFARPLGAQYTRQQHQKWFGHFIVLLIIINCAMHNDYVYDNCDHYCDNIVRKWLG